MKPLRLALLTPCLAVACAAPQPERRAVRAPTTPIATPSAPVATATQAPTRPPPATQAPTRPPPATDAPDFTLTTLEGGSFTLSAYRGRLPVVLNFWAPW